MTLTRLPATVYTAGQSGDFANGIRTSSGHSATALRSTLDSPATCWSVAIDCTSSTIVPDIPAAILLRMARFLINMHGLFAFLPIQLLTEQPSQPWQTIRLEEPIQ